MKARRFELMNDISELDIDFVKYRLTAFPALQDYAYIVHDRDRNVDGFDRAEHLHLIMRFKYAVPASTIASKFKVKEQYIQKLEGSWTSVCRYLIHANHPEKAQYSKDEVTANFDYAASIAVENEGQDNRKSYSKKVDTRKREIIELIEAGVIKRYNYFNYITAVEYDKYSSTLDKQFSLRNDKMIYSSGDREMEVIYIFGKSGLGKTTEAKRIAEKKGYQYTISSSSNDYLESYCGQECLILDDFRIAGNVLKSDVLKLLDNNTSSTIKSRYRNKSLAECKLIIVTSIVSPSKLWVDTGEDEDVHQFLRRIQLVLEVLEKEIRVYAFDSTAGTHEHVSTYAKEHYFDKQQDKINLVKEFMSSINAKGIKESTTINHLEIATSPF